MVFCVEVRLIPGYKKNVGGAMILLLKPWYGGSAKSSNFPIKSIFPIEPYYKRD